MLAGFFIFQRNFELQLVFFLQLNIFKVMNRIGNLVLLPCALFVTVIAQAKTDDSRYEAIVDRNIFRLTSPPPPPAAPTNTEALDRVIELSGITSISGKKKAWFIVKAKGAKEPEYINLGENERQGFLEVVNISEAEGEVKVVNSGNAMTLSFKNNAPKALPTPAAPPVAPVAANLPGGTAAPSRPASSYGSTGSPSRGGSSVTISGGSPTPAYGQTAQANDSGLRTIPARTLRLSPQQQQQQSVVDPQKQREMMEIQKAVYDAAGVPIPPLPPPTSSAFGRPRATPPVPGGPPMPR